MVPIWTKQEPITAALDVKFSKRQIAKLQKALISASEFPIQPEIDDGFGHWLAGFIDGEGCFTIIQNANGSWEVKFYLTLRDDDASILETIQDCLEIGRIYRTREHGTSRPQASWRVTRQDECLRLIEILDRFPLRARKARDYQIWREAVFAKSEKSYGEDGGLSHLSIALKTERAYKPQTSER